MREIEVELFLKRYSVKKKERLIKLPEFVFSAEIGCRLALFWLGVCVKQKIKHLEMDKYIIINFALQRHLAFLKDLFFVFVSFSLVAIFISVSLLGNR